MPIVPLYPRGEVSPRSLSDAAPNVPAAGDPALFGADRARDLQLAGQQLGQASESLAALYERTAREANDTRVQDLTNRFLGGRRTILHTWSNRTGADVIAGADAAIANLTSLKDEVFGQSANGYQRQRLGPILDAHLAASTADVTRHAAVQQEVYSRGVATAAIETSRAEAIADPTLMDNALFRAEGAARALYAGQPLEAVEAGVRAAGESVVAGVIGDRLARNDPQGVTLFRQYADRLEPSDRRTLGAAAGTLSNSIDAAAWLRERSATLRTPAPTGDAALDAVNIANGSTAEPPPVISSAGTLLDPDGGIVGTRQRLDEIDQRRRALTVLNESEFAANPARLRANQTAIDTDTARSRAAVKADTDTLYADLRRHLTTAGPNGGPAVTPPPATIMSRLTDAQQDAVTAQVNANVEGRSTSTDPQTWCAIRRGLTAADAGERQRWASKNLVQFMGRLSAEDFAELEKLQSAVRSSESGSGQRRLQAVTRMADDALRSVGIDPTPRPDAAPGSDAARAARFHRALQDELLAFESRGQKPTEAETNAIVHGLKHTAIKDGWLKGTGASPAVRSDIPSTDDALHRDGEQLAHVEPSAQPEQDRRLTIGLDFGRLRRMRKEDDLAAAGTIGAPGAPATEPYPGSPEYQVADAEARRIATEQAADGAGDQGGPQTEPLPGSPGHRAAEAEARKLENDAWTKIGFFRQMGIAFERFDEESKKRGATFNADSAARRLETVLELQRRQANGEELNVAERRYLLKNRNVAADLASAVGRLIDAQRRLDELPMSDPLRRLFEAPTVADAGRLLREDPGAIARAIGVESLPALTVSLMAMAALGPVGGAIALTGTSGLDGYSKGLIGALARAGVDVSNAEDLYRALQNAALMERVRKDATTDGAIEAGVTAAAMMIGVRRRGATTRTVGKTPNASPHASDGVKVPVESAAPGIAADLPPGSFSISDWSAYPSIVSQPQGPFRIVQGAEYVAERIAKKRANAAFRRKQGLVGQPVDVHEIQPVKFGGSPTDPANKVVLPRDVHRQQVTPWWNKLLKDLGY
jgi:hypothetical protein